MNYEKIGEFIAARRKVKDLTQNELAKKVGVTDKAVSKWERGLGCPDVSILEVLANELDVSVLELLKGREIENEVIKVTEADDYIKESLSVSNKMIKDKIIDKASKIIFLATLIISILFIILTFKNYFVSRQGEYLYIDSEDFSESRDEQIAIMKNNLDIIRNNRGILTVNEQKMLVDGLNELIKHYENHYVYHLDPKRKYTTGDILKYYLNDVMEYSSVPFGIIPLMNVFRNHNISVDLVPLAALSAMEYQQIVDRDFYDYYSYRNHEYMHLKVSESIQEYIGYGTIESLGDCIDGFDRANVRYLKMYNALLSELIKAGGFNA